MIDDVLTDASRRMDKTVEATRHEFTTVRTGRASTALLDRVQVEAYGTRMPLNQLATISVPEPRMLTITPFDKSTMRDIERAIQAQALTAGHETCAALRTDVEGITGRGIEKGVLRIRPNERALIGGPGIGAGGK